MVRNRIPSKLPARDTLVFLSNIVCTEYQPVGRGIEVARILLALSDRLAFNLHLRATGSDLLAGYIFLATQEPTAAFSAERIRSYAKLGALLGAAGTCPAVNLTGAIAIWETWVLGIRDLGRHNLDSVINELVEELGMLKRAGGG